MHLIGAEQHGLDAKAVPDQQRFGEERLDRFQFPAHGTFQILHVHRVAAQCPSLAFLLGKLDFRQQINKLDFKPGFPFPPSQGAAGVDQLHQFLRKSGSSALLGGRSRRGSGHEIVFGVGLLKNSDQFVNPSKRLANMRPIFYSGEYGLACERDSGCGSLSAS